MPPSEKIAAPWSVALTAALVLGTAALFALKDPFWPPAFNELAERVAAIWFKPGATGNELPAKVAKGDSAAADADAAASSKEGAAAGETPRDAAFLVPPLSWTHLEIEAALMECLSMLAPVTAEIVPLAPHAYGGCGTPAPVLLRSLGAKPKVVLDPPLLINCPVVVALNQWLESKVQPAARETLGSPVARIMASSYACRTPYNLPSDRLSQHAFANAVDLPVFVLADGRTISLTNGWGPTRRDLEAPAKPKLVPVVTKEAAAVPAANKDAQDQDQAPSTLAEAAVVVKASTTGGLDAGKPEASPAPDPLSKPEAKFLRQVHQGACESFSTVLGPEANDVHRTHLHLDLQDRNGMRVCH